MKGHYLAALALLAAAPAHALVITPVFVYAEATAKTPGGSNTDSKSGGTSANATESSSYTVTVPGFGSTTDTVDAAAYQRDDGFSRIELNVESNGQFPIATTGKLTEYGAEGKTALYLEYFNDEALAIAPIFNFSLSNVAADTTHAGGDPVEAEFKFDVSSSGSGDSFSASATARSTYNNAEIVNQNNMSGNAVPYECSSGFCFRAAYLFDDIMDSISVGLLDPGATATVFVDMSAETTFNGTEQGAYARIQDPNGGSAFSYTTTFANVGGPPPSQVPLTSTALLFMGGLGGLFAVRRRKRA